MEHQAGQGNVGADGRDALWRNAARVFVGPGLSASTRASAGALRRNHGDRRGHEHGGACDVSMYRWKDTNAWICDNFLVTENGAEGLHSFPQEIVELVEWI
ncbi:MAG: hypothetical protein GEU95_12260 [Rhizobiales bacterium]|nr:hypothetical protein [Hyphomicrobiales bacterium]